MQMYMSYEKWMKLSKDQQQAYMDRQGIEVVGYTSVGTSTTPNTVEFGPRKFQNTEPAYMQMQCLLCQEGMEHGNCAFS